MSEVRSEYKVVDGETFLRGQGVPISPKYPIPTFPQHKVIRDYALTRIFEQLRKVVETEEELRTMYNLLKKKHGKLYAQEFKRFYQGGKSLL